MNVQDLRLIRRMAPLMPIKDPLVKEKSQIDTLEFSKVTTFITTRPVLKEIAFYYLLHNKVIDFVKLFSAEEIKNIYFNNHPVYEGLDSLGSPIMVILLGKELYNSQMVVILNILVDNFLRQPCAKALIFAYEGTVQDFKNKYKNAQERGILNTGKTISFTQTSVKSKTTYEL